jgi:predicted ATPase/DNA-binding winged helix-turn-helix (wHTH) protein
VPGPSICYACGQVQVDLVRRELTVKGEPAFIGDRAFEVLGVLVQSAGQLVTRNELMRHVWPDVVVEENTLEVHVSALRKALGSERRLLKTVHARGYRLLGSWTVLERAAVIDAVAVPRAMTRPSRTNLPIAVSALIGRTALVLQLLNLLSAHRIVTLVGVGGIGKTRLALEAAHLLVSTFGDNVRLVELASLVDSALVPSAVAREFGLDLGGDESSAESVARAIGEEHALLVLDNCEHVIDGAATSADAIVRLSPRVTVLATSREVLRVDGEHVFRVPPLDVPHAESEEPSQLLTSSAAELFVTLARKHDSTFFPRDDDALAIAAICRRLDGIPLAIEFAAARAATLGVRQVAWGLSDRFALLTVGRRAALPRHRTLRATLDWSYDLLPATEAATLSTLAIFAGEFPLDAAIAVTGDVTGPQVLDIISNLVTKSLVVADVQDCIPNFRLLETIRLYALEKLRDSGGAPRAARCHAMYYCGLAEQAERESRTRTEADWLAVYGRNLDNWRAALDWAFSADGDTDIGMALTAGALPVWFKLSLRDECRRRIEQALSFARADTDPNVTMRLNAGLGAVLFYTKRGATPAVADAWERVLLIADHLDDNEHRLWARWGLWNYQMNHCEFSKALVSARHFKSLAIDPTDVAAGNRMLGVTLHYIGSHAPARDHLESVLALRVDTDARSIVRNQYDLKLAARCYLPRILWLQGFPDQAMRAAERAFRDASAAGHTLSLSLALVHAACPVSLWTGDLVAADGFVATLMDHSTTQGPGFWHAEARCFDGILRVMRGDVAAGLQMFQPAMRELADHNAGMNITGYIAAMAGALATSDDITNGAPLVDEGLLRAERDGDHWSMPELLRLRGEFLLREDGPGAATSAEALYRRSLDWAVRQGSLAWALRAATSLADLLLGQNRFGDAISVITPVHGMFAEGFETVDLRRANRTLGALGIGPLES